MKSTYKNQMHILVHHLTGKVARSRKSIKSRPLLKVGSGPEQTISQEKSIFYQERWTEQCIFSISVHSCADNIGQDRRSEMKFLY